jgi:hypothetical protein
MGAPEKCATQVVWALPANIELDGNACHGQTLKIIKKIL